MIIRPGRSLQGAIEIKGAKNSVLKLMAATLLATGTHVIENVPRITDVSIMADLLRSMGVSVSDIVDGRLTIVVPPEDEVIPRAPYELVEKIRASIVVLGPLVARYRRTEVSMPGGDDFGHRPINFHLNALEALGANFEASHGYISATTAGLMGTRVVLEYPSHTATDNVLMASVLAKGTTVIENAAKEPEIIDLSQMLIEMGAKISGAGTSRIEVEGVDELIPANHRVIADRVEAATMAAAVGLATGNVNLIGAPSMYMDMVLEKMSAIGLIITQTSDGINVICQDRLKATDVATLPYPGVATDYKPLIVTMLSVADGVSIVTENLFSGRFKYVDELRRMGADIRTEGHHAVIRGVARLSGAPVKGTDIRAAAALALAGLAADSETILTGASHIARGYEDFAGRLRAVGADIEHVLVNRPENQN
ncbi:MAG: UDP-N-acetylglucosamine 1-carboxyvinyltransferase [Actinomycetota bacterium]|nr:MAG: UDP-N-acetylglucosamine 1-carboxyvinyltransferase [Actinomycetota bacterium]